MEEVRREQEGGHRSEQVPRGRAVHRVLWAGGGPVGPPWVVYSAVCVKVDAANDASNKLVESYAA